MKQLIINVTKGSTFLHQLNGKTKVMLFITSILAIIMSFDLRIIAPLFIVYILSLISLKPNWKVVLGLLGFILIMQIFNLVLYWLVNPNIGAFYTDGKTTILFHWGSSYLSLQTAFYLAVRLLKMITSFLASLTFVFSITPGELAAGLYGLGMPYKFSTIISLALRYIPDISRDYEAIQVAMQTRGLELDKRRLNPFKRLKESIYILVPLVITSFDRIGNIANAMDLRAFGVQKNRTYYCELEPTRYDHLFRTLAILCFVLSIAWIVARMIVPPTTWMWYPY